MRIAAALAWYDEPVGHLRRLVASLAGVVDELVAFDGRWRLMPGFGDLSPIEQSEALREAAALVDLPAAVWAAAPVGWGSQVAKRAALMEQAGESSDWILVIDGDEYVDRCDAGALRTALWATDHDVAEVTLRTLNRAWPYEHLAPMVTQTRRLYRAGTRVVGPAHNDYARDGERLNGDPANGPLADALELDKVLSIAHDNRNRGSQRNAAAEAYRLARRAEGVEVAA